MFLLLKKPVILMEKACFTRSGSLTLHFHVTMTPRAEVDNMLYKGQHFNVIFVTGNFNVFYLKFNLHDLNYKKICF